MVDILVRDLDDDVAHRLEERARASGTSVDDVVREAIGAYVHPPRAAVAHVRPSRPELVERVRRIREMSPPPTSTSRRSSASTGTTMSLIVDASVAVKWFVTHEDGLDAAQAILDDESEALLAPDISR